MKLGGDFNILSFPNGNFEALDAGNTDGVHTPPFIFKKAVVRVNGVSEVVHDVAAGTDINGGFLKMSFKSGRAVIYDPATVQPPEGEKPEFIAKRDKVELRGHTRDVRDDGLWTVHDHYFSQKEGEPVLLYLDLRRRKIAQGFNDKLQTVFKAATLRAPGGFAPQPIKLFPKMKIIKRPG